MLVVQSSANDEVTDDPSPSVPVLVEVNEPIRYEVRAQEHDSVVASAAVAVVLLIDRHSDLRDYILDWDQLTAALAWSVGSLADSPKTHLSKSDDSQ